MWEIRPKQCNLKMKQDCKNNEIFIQLYKCMYPQKKELFWYINARISKRWSNNSSKARIISDYKSCSNFIATRCSGNRLLFYYAI